MKAGLVVTIHALARLRDRGRLPPVRFLVTTDEETGSDRSREEIEAEARRCGRVLVMEPCGVAGAVKRARKGVALGRLVAHGRASHAGLAPEHGVNAVVGLGGVLPSVAALSDPELGTTVTPTLIAGGTAVNTVPASCEARVDVRFLHPHEVERVGEALSHLVAPGGAEMESSLVVNRPALEPAASEPLLPALHAAAAAVGQEVGTVTVGGASDGNLAAAVGAAVLDGLGPEGDGAHADHEHVLVGGLLRRAALLAALIPEVAATDVAAVSAP